jgi:hypothetical protein
MNKFYVQCWCGMLYEGIIIINSDQVDLLQDLRNVIMNSLNIPTSKRNNYVLEIKILTKLN